MALNKRSRSRWWSRLHFLVRFAGLTGLLVGCVGLLLVLLGDLWETVLSWQAGRAIVLGETGDPYARLAVGLLLGGGLAALLALLVEAILILAMVAGRRSAFGFNAVVQTAIAA